ncbi:ankyrin repeat and death domain-containing protein 1A-like isoform X1 [Euwallacea fornicatus]|uniref:ankyrin repeat and death domain-containing protein 1A-like isoform X1 n=1 Tax=Euwallacea fornicatus TaxID=995702 RepID=UPI00338F82A1
MAQPLQYISCPNRTNCASPANTPEELERRAIIQRNDLLLHEAVIKNDTDGVKKVLKEPVDINSRNNYGRAPIHWASARGNIEIMEMLLNARCDIEARDKYGMRPLHMAAWHGHPKAVELLINSGACTNSVTKAQYTLLICAARNNRAEVIDFLLDTLDDVQIDAVDADGQTALYHAAANGHVIIVKRLLEMGASLDKKNKENRTALHEAAQGGHEEVTQMLLVKDAAMEARDHQGNTPLHIAVQHQQNRVVQVLLETGADTDGENQRGNTALHIAASLGSRGILECLLQHGASLAVPNQSGNTALHMACQATEVETVEMLINKGANLNCLNKRLQTPIHIAAEMGHTEICKLLLAAGANIEQREQGGRTPLYIAARGSFTAIVDMIIKTARLDYPGHEESHENKKDGSSIRRKLSKGWRTGSKDEGKAKEYERLKEILYKLAYKHLSPGEWKRLAHYWAFTDDQIKAIEHQYNGNNKLVKFALSITSYHLGISSIGPSSYKEHGFRMMLIWIHGLSPELNPVRELYESLVAIGKKPLADTLRRKIDQENEARRRGHNKQKCNRCSIS